MNPEVTHDMIMDTVDGMAARVYVELDNNDGIRPETIRTLWGCVHWQQSMVERLAGAG